MPIILDAVRQVPGIRLHTTTTEGAALGDGTAIQVLILVLTSEWESGDTVQDSEALAASDDNSVGALRGTAGAMNGDRSAHRHPFFARR
jgi:hypothetical protein